MLISRLLLITVLLSTASLSYASYECVGKSFNFSLDLTEEKNVFIGSFITKSNQLLLRVQMSEGKLMAQDKESFKTAFAGENSKERVTLYVGKANKLSYLNIERNIGSPSTYPMTCTKQ